MDISIHNVQEILLEPSKDLKGNLGFNRKIAIVHKTLEGDENIVILNLFGAFPSSLLVTSHE